jgi:hypothetical protein
MSSCTTTRRGVTLVEIALSLGLVTMAVLTIVLTVPSGIRVQTEVRYKVIAAAKAMEVMELLRGQMPGMIHDARDQDKEGIFPWDARTTTKAMAPDLESALENLRGNVRPLPTAIARRLDSDNDEIARLLAAGGRLYYFFPDEPVDVLESVPSYTQDQEWLPQAKRLLLGVVGAPQQNAILHHPSVKVGPYQAFYPSPPSHGRERAPDLGNGPARSALAAPTHISYEALCLDDNIREVMTTQGVKTYNYTRTISTGANSNITNVPMGYWPYMQFVWSQTGADTRVARRPGTAPTGTSGNARFGDAVFEDAKRRAIAYAVIALRYAVDSGGFTLNELFTTCTNITQGEALANQAAVHDPAVNVNAWKRVLALRYLAHAASTMSAYYPFGLPSAGASFAGDPAIPAGQMSLGSIDAANLEAAGYRLTLDRLRAWHEAAVRAAIRHADAAGPYHWAAPRPLNRQNMMDHPLVQLAPWSTPITWQTTFDTVYPSGFNSGLGDNFPPLVNSNAVVFRQWKACYPQTILMPGVPRMFPGRWQDTTGDGLVDSRDTVSTADYPARLLDAGSNGPLNGGGGNEGDGLNHLDLNVPASGGGWQAAVAPAADFNLTAPFAPQERCRQMVFWAVDWQSYADFETCPSEPIDSGRIASIAPGPGKAAAASTHTATSVARTPYQRLIHAQGSAGLVVNSQRNPELVSVYRVPSLRDASDSVNDRGTLAADGAVRTGEVAVVGEIHQGGPQDESDPGLSSAAPRVPDQRDGSPGAGGTNFTGTYANTSFASQQIILGHDPALWNSMVLLGRYGANRDGIITTWSAVAADETARNWLGRGRPAASVDGGSVPRTVRLRASTVARFNFYDPRLTGALRQ